MFQLKVAVALLQNKWSGGGIPGRRRWWLLQNWGPEERDKDSEDFPAASPLLLSHLGDVLPKRGLALGLRMVG